ncbi:unnamed protein product [Ostreobium quekettii]|uniref:Coenzyme Q-binding protein COQ10 START domain-containing protein n=1 Tax=Ostreobium quekettii TaxID=121088 RepID=A0A8S1J8A1_9CHLO|nr:unnamed protein product [Ostreobium quekettii]|eukprot:evm.model.scf_161.14 EVM.evm.TU.scf_161.14   scf_161:131202-132098(-)
MVWPFGRGGKSADADDGLDQDAAPQPTVDNWSSRDCKIQVTQPEGFAQRVKMHAKVDLPPHMVFDILVDKDNARYFRGVKGTTYRRVLEDRWGYQKVEVEQAAGWRFLFLSGVFYTRLFVFQHRHKGIVHFRLAQPGFMEKFEGNWVVRPFCQRTLDSLGREPTALSRLGSIFSGLPSLARETDATLVTLEQSVKPKYAVPRALSGYMTKISAGVLRDLMEDLKKEAERVKRGDPIPRYQIKKLEAARRLKKHHLKETSMDTAMALQKQGAALAMGGKGVGSIVISGWRPAWFDQGGE